MIMYNQGGQGYKGKKYGKQKKRIIQQIPKSNVDYFDSPGSSNNIYNIKPISNSNISSRKQIKTAEPSSRMKHFSPQKKSANKKEFNDDFLGQMYKLREQEYAATKIQTRFRGNQSRKRVKKLKKQYTHDFLENEDASKIQTRFRGNQDRNRYRQMRQEDNAARSIQKGWRHKKKKMNTQEN